MQLGQAGGLQLGQSTAHAGKFGDLGQPTLGDLGQPTLGDLGQPTLGGLGQPTLGGRLFVASSPGLPSF